MSVLKKISRKAKEAARRAEEAAKRAAREAKNAAKKVEAAAKAAEQAAREEAERVAVEAQKAAEAAAREAERAAKRATDATQRALEAAEREAKGTADRLKEFTEEDVAGAARGVGHWTGDAAGDVGEWAKTASDDAKKGLVKASKFVDSTSTDMANGLEEAADAVDDVLENVASELPDGLVIFVGPFEVSCAGVELKPKWEYGFEGAGIAVKIGVGDLRDGINVGISVDVELFRYVREGDDLQELLADFEATAVLNTKVPDEAARIINFYMSRSTLPRIVFELSGVNVNLYGRMRVECAFIAGVGVRAEVSLGSLFKDTNDFRMFGVGGEVAVGAKLKLDVFAGYRESDGAVRLVVGVPPGLVMEVVFTQAFDEALDVVKALDVDDFKRAVLMLPAYLSGSKPYARSGLAM